MDQLFNLPADLPENWTVNQTIAPEGPFAGLNEQHGYNYLMKQVNAAQRACNLLREELANKADKGRCETYNLEPADGIVSEGFYIRTQEHLVVITAHFYREDGSPFPDGELLFTIPAGFRPTVKCVVPVAVESIPSGTRQIAWLHLYNDGKAHYASASGLDTSKVHTLSCYATYLAQ